MIEFSYYMLRIHEAPEAGPDALGGVLERLGSGEKHRFASTQELLHLLGTRVESENMSPAPEPRNDEPDGRGGTP